MSGGSSLGTARRILLLPAAIIVSISLLFLICHLTQERSDELQCCLTDGVDDLHLHAGCEFSANSPCLKLAS